MKSVKNPFGYYTGGSGTQRILSGGERDGLGRGAARWFGCRPRDTVRRAASDSGNLDAFKSVNQSRPPVDCRTTVALLAVVVVTPSQYLAGISDGQAVEGAH